MEATAAAALTPPKTLNPKPHRFLLTPSFRRPRTQARAVTSSCLPLVSSSTTPPPPPPPPASPKEGGYPKIDRTGRFCSLRAARELALLISYAACLEGSDAVRLFDRRVNAKREPGFVFNKASLLSYDHMSFGGGPVQAGTEEEVEELMSQNEKDSANEVEVLSAPLKLVYNKFVLQFAREILVAVVNGWDQNVTIINKIIPQPWKDEPIARILELCILHIAMSEMRAKGTRHPIVINEAVDLAKRFCDGGAPRIINGCLRTFVKNHLNIDTVRPAESKA